MLAAVNLTAGKIVAAALGATDPNAWVAFATQAQWENGGAPRANNPFNLTDPGRAMTWKAYGQTGWYAGTEQDDFAAFATLAGGERAAAVNYLREGSYGTVISACLAGDGPVAIAAAIQSSPWSTDHYGDKLSARTNAELVALFAAAAAAKAKEDPVSEQITTFTPSRRGTVKGGTRRFAADAPYAERSPLPADGYLFDAWVVIDQTATPHGHFLRTTTAPPDLVASTSVTLDPPIATDLPPATGNLPDVLAPSSNEEVPAGSSTPAANDAFIASGLASGALVEKTDALGHPYYAQNPAVPYTPQQEQELLTIEGPAQAAGNPDGSATPATPATPAGDFTGVVGLTTKEGGQFLYQVYRDGQLLGSKLGPANEDTVALEAQFNS